MDRKETLENKNRQAGTVRISTSVSLEMWEIANKLHISWAEAIRKGLALIFSEIDINKESKTFNLSPEEIEILDEKIDKYKNNLNHSRKMRGLLFALNEVQKNLEQSEIEKEMLKQKYAGVQK
jgi:hypothetical protein